jgi:hypothetical protein
MAQSLGYISEQRSLVVIDKIDHTGRSLSSFINKPDIWP